MFTWKIWFSHRRHSIIDYYLTTPAELDCVLLNRGTSSCPWSVAPVLLQCSIRFTYYFLQGAGKECATLLSAGPYRDIFWVWNVNVANSKGTKGGWVHCLHKLHLPIPNNRVRFQSCGSHVCCRGTSQGCAISAQLLLTCFIFIHVFPSFSLHIF